MGYLKVGSIIVFGQYLGTERCICFLIEFEVVIHDKEKKKESKLFIEQIIHGGAVDILFSFSAVVVVVNMVALMRYF